MAKKRERGLTYIGPGFIPGVPARDLTPEEVQEYGGERVLLTVTSPHRDRPLYERKVEETEEVDE